MFEDLIKSNDNSKIQLKDLNELYQLAIEENILNQTQKKIKILF